MFLPDRYVEGECPLCGHPGARGDQCDNCGGTYEVTELKNPRVAIEGDGSTPVLKQTPHWFLKLDAFSERLSAWVETHTDGKPQFREVHLGALQGGMRVIAGGSVKAGENVIVEGLQRVIPGMPVAPQVLKVDANGLPIPAAPAAAASGAARP